MGKYKGNRIVTGIIYRLFSLTMALCICFIPVLGSQPVHAAPPPGSTAASTFTSASTPPPPPPASSTSSATGTMTSGDATATTDKINYEHGETADISGAGFIPGSDVTVTVTTPEGTTTNWTVQADANGNVSTNYTFGDGKDGLFTAVLSDGTSSATTVFTDPAVILYPNQDIKTDLSVPERWVPGHRENGRWIWGHYEPIEDRHYKCVDETSGNDGDTTYVYNMHGGRQTDIYGFTDLPSDFTLVDPDKAAPNTPAPTSTTHSTGTWSNNPNIAMTWNSVGDNGGTASNPTVQIVTVARAHWPVSGDFAQLAVVKSSNGQIVYSPTYQLTENYQPYTYTMNTDPDGNPWTTASVNNIQAGIALQNVGLQGSRATQVYAVVTSGSQGATGVDHYNYSWDGSSGETVSTSVTSSLGDGSHSFGVNAEDKNGNTSGTSSSGSYLIDTRAPVVTTNLDGTTNNGWYNSTAVGSDNQLGVTVNANDTNGATPVSGVNYIVYKIGTSPSNQINNTSTSGATGNGKSATQTITYNISTQGGTNQGAVALANSSADVAGNSTNTSQTVLIDTVAPTLTTNHTGTSGNNDWHTSVVNVNLNASDATSGVDNIQYSINGGATATSTNPNWTDAGHNYKSSPYSAATTIAGEGVNTLTSSATDVAGNTSATNTDTIKIDTKAPTITHTGISGTAGDNGWYKSAVNIKTEATDVTSGVDSITDSLNGTITTSTNLTWANETDKIKSSPYSTTTAVTGEGVNTLNSSSQDAAGNTSGVVSSTIRIDASDPTVSNSYSGTMGNNGWYTSNVNATIDAADTVSGVDRIQYSLSGSSVDGSHSWAGSGYAVNPTWKDQTNQIKSSPFSIDAGLTDEGITNFNSSASDTAGNTAFSPTDTIKIDKTGPTLTTTGITGTAGNYGWYKSTVNVTNEATDATSGVDSITNTLNGTSNTSTNLTWADETNKIKSSPYSTTTSVTGEGVNILDSVSQDAAGNNSGVVTNSIKVDTLGPTLSSSLNGTAGENGWYISAVDVNLNASDATSGVDKIQYSLNGGAETTSTNLTWTDTTNNIKSSPYSASATVAGEGVNTLTSSATDVAGNSSATNTDTVKVDTVDPTLVKTINGAAPKDNTINNGWYNAADLTAGGGTLNISLVSTDATSGVQTISYSVNGVSATDHGGGANSYTTNFTLDDSNQGVNQLTHSAKDMAGNTYELAAQEVKLDSILPTIVSSIARTGLDQVTVTLVGSDALSGSGIDNIAYSADGGTKVTVVGTGYDQTVTYIVTGVGAHALAQSIADIAGNQSGLNDSFNIGQAAGVEGMNKINAAVPMLTFSLQNGTMVSSPVTTEGVLISDVDLTSQDGLLTINIPAGTKVVNDDGTPTYLNQDPDIIAMASSNDNAPEGTQMISSYEFGPAGVTFDSPITVAVNYDPAELPGGSQPIIAAYNDETGQWTELETAGYVAADGSEPANTAAARFSKLSRFAILAK